MVSEICQRKEKFIQQAITGNQFQKKKKRTNQHLIKLQGRNINSQTEVIKESFWLGKYCDWTEDDQNDSNFMQFQASTRSFCFYFSE